MDLNQITSWILGLVLFGIFVVFPISAYVFGPQLRRHRQRRQLARLRREIATEGIDPNSPDGQAEFRRRLKAELGKADLSPEEIESRLVNLNAAGLLGLGR